MLVNTKRLMRALVRTKSGTPLGKLLSVDIDADTGRLMAIRVAPGGMVTGLLSDELVIGWQYIVSLSEEEIVVEDAYSALTATTATLARAQET